MGSSVLLTGEQAGAERILSSLRASLREMTLIGNWAQFSLAVQSE